MSSPTPPVKNGLCSDIEYRAIFDLIHSLPDPNVLVFGLGRDSVLWDSLTPNCYFIENIQKWIDMNKKLKVYKVEYRSKHLSKTSIDKESQLKILKGFPDSLYTIKWDVIFVDSPVGRTQGRMKSIYKAYQLRSENTHIFVHDYNRLTEKLYCDHFLGIPDKIIHRLAYYESSSSIRSEERVEESR